MGVGRAGGGRRTNRASFSGASVCIFLKLNFIYLFIYLFIRIKIQENSVNFVQSFPSVCDR